MMYFSFIDWLNSLSIIFSRSNHPVAKYKSFLFLLLHSIPLYKCTTTFYFTFYEIFIIFFHYHLVSYNSLPQQSPHCCPFPLVLFLFAQSLFHSTSVPVTWSSSMNMSLFCMIVQFVH